MSNKFNYRALANEVVLKGINLFADFGEWTKGAMALADLGEDGRPLFHAISSLADNYNETENDKKFNNALRTRNRVGIASFIYQCKCAGIDTKKFMEQDDDIPIAMPKRVRELQRDSTKVCYIPAEYVKRSLDKNCQSNLLKFLCTIFDKKDVEAAVRKYALGITRNGSTIYWQIDSHGVRTGKVMQYLTNGHRDKSGGDKIDWIHSILKKKGKLPAGWELTQCLFGAHLIGDNKTIGLVESEKSAVICSIVHPDAVWVSCGGIGNLEAGNKHLLLKGHKVVLFPDTDTEGKAYTKWNEKAIRWRECGIEVKVSDLLERKATKEQKEAKIDIADLIINYVSINDRSILDDMIRRNPAVGLLVEKFDLEETNNGQEVA